MSIEVTCPVCSASFRIRDEEAGGKIKCPDCLAPINAIGKSFQVVDESKKATAVRSFIEATPHRPARTSEGRDDSIATQKPARNNTALIIALLVGIPLCLSVLCAGIGTAIYFLASVSPAPNPPMVQATVEVSKAVPAPNSVAPGPKANEPEPPRQAPKEPPAPAAKGKSTATMSDFQQLQIGMEQKEVEAALGMGKIATAKEVEESLAEAINGTDPASTAQRKNLTHIFADGAKQSQTMIWRSQTTVILVLFTMPPDKGGVATYFFCRESVTEGGFSRSQTATFGAIPN
jgi:predicted Zn finger-like uncharacterized protein